ncbi:MAG: LexA family protein [Bacteroidia bacterium]
MAKRLKIKQPNLDHPMLDLFQPAFDRRFELSLYTDSVAAGFPTPASTNEEQHLDLNEYLVRRPESTFLVRVSGESMIHAGILDGDLLVVDTNERPSDGRIVIAFVAGEFTVKRLVQKGKNLFLMPENKKFQPIAIDAKMGVEIRGVVTHIIHKA